MDELGGRVAVVTGGGRGLGRVTALALLEAGASVLITSRDRATLEDTAAASGAGDRVHLVVADMSTPQGCDAIVAAALERFGRVDVLFNNAGIGPDSIKSDLLLEPYRFWELDWDTLQRFHTVNSVAPTYLTSQVVPAMVERGWGRVVNDTTSLSTMLHFSGYGGSKASMEAHTACMANDLAGTGVTANVLVPGGAAATRMSDALGTAPGDLVIDPQVMAAPSVWLASTASDGVTGRRFIASKWDTSLASADAAALAGSAVAWTDLATPTALKSKYAR